jgi:hypothetical protein
MERQNNRLSRWLWTKILNTIATRPDGQFCRTISTCTIPLDELADMIDWAASDWVAAEPFLRKPGRPMLRPRLIVGLLYLQRAFKLSDEQVVAGSLLSPVCHTQGHGFGFKFVLPVEPENLT